MVCAKRVKKLIFKTISALVAGIFLFEQVTWAGDLIETVLDRQYYEQAQTFAPAYLQTQQAAAESLIDQQQTLDDLSSLQYLSEPSQTTTLEPITPDLIGPRGGTVTTYATTAYTVPTGQDYPSQGDTTPQDPQVLSITTTEGDIIHYRSGQIDYIEKKEGDSFIIIKRVQDPNKVFVDSDSNLANAEIVYPDQTVMIVSDYKVARITKPDGTIFEYSDTLTQPDGTIFTYAKGELITKATYPDPDNPTGNIVDYFYAVGNEGSILETKLRDSEKSSYYDKDGIIKRVEFNSGKTVTYTAGVISEVKDENGVRYIYNSLEEAPDGATVRLKEIKDRDNNIFRVENNNIVEVEIPNKAVIRDFTLTAEWRIINARIRYLDGAGSEILVENGLIKEVTGSSGIKATYEYALDGNGATITIDDQDVITNYTYTKDPLTGKLTIVDGDMTYYYDAAWNLEKFHDVTGTFEHAYGLTRNYLGSVFTGENGSVSIYNKDRVLEKVISPDGFIYDYRTTPEGNIVISKRTLYSYNNLYQSYSSTANISRTLSPTLKASFRLDSSKPGSSMSTSASYYKSTEKNVSFSLSIYNQKPQAYYYYYNYQTKQTVSQNVTLDMTIGKDTDYTVEYLWSQAGVNVYLYKSSESRPQTPLYVISDTAWDPRFYISGTNANISLDPSSSGAYSKYKSAYTDYANPLKNGPSHTFEFKFDSSSAYKSLYYSAYLNQNALSDSISLNYYNNKLSLNIYRYDYKTAKGTSTAVPLAITFKDNTTYIVESKMEDNALKFYIYEKGTISPAPIYTVGNISGDPRISASISGGDLKVQAYDRLERYEYDSDNRLIRQDKPDKTAIIYDYKLDAFGRLNAYKRYSYSGNNTSINYYASTYIDRALNPALKTFFKLDGSKASSYTNIYASYYSYNDKSISLFLNLSRGQKARVNYSFYNYVTKQNISESKELTLTINKDTNYTAEYVWTATGVNVYLYETSLGRTTTPAYTLTNREWNPRFSVSGNNADVLLDPSSSGVYTRYGSVSTDYANPLRSSPIYASEFKLDPIAPYKSVYYSIYGSTAAASDSIYFRYYNNAASLNLYHYDYVTRKSTSSTIPLNISLKDGLSYVVKSKIEDGIFSLYIYEKGKDPGSPVYTMNNVSWNPQISSSITGGEVKADAYDRLEVFEYTSQQDLAVTLPSYALDCPAPLVFPDGKTDILNNIRPDIDFSIPLPAGLFGVTGVLKDDLDFKNIPYFDAITYGADRNIVSIEKPNGETISYYEGENDLRKGLVKNTTDAQGSILTYYDYTLSQLNDVSALTVIRNDITTIYDRYGNVSQVSDPKEGISFTMAGNTVSRIEKSDGSIVEAIYSMLDTTKIIGYRIIKKDGVEVVYKYRVKEDGSTEGVLTEIKQPDGSHLIYDLFGNIQEYKKEGMVYEYTDSAETEVDENGRRYIIGIATEPYPPDIKDEDIIYQKYQRVGDTKRLVQLQRKNLKHVNYVYYTDGAGAVTSTEVTDEMTNTKTTYDADNNITRSEILPTADDPIPTISEYDYGRIRNVYKGAVLIYRYTYEFDDSGKEVTVITDVKTGDVKRYKDELLISVTDSKNLVTTYEYNTDKKISKSTVTRSGKLINQYIYTYEGDLTVIEDMDGVKRSYDKDNKIIYLEESGRKYQYVYSKDDSGKDITTQKLISVKNDAGDVINYNDGKIVSIVRPDGTVLKDFISVNETVTGYTVEKDNVRYFVEDGKVVKEIKADGTIVEYYPNGWAKSTTDPDGKVTNYDYEVDATESLVLEGVAENTSIANIYTDNEAEPSLLLQFDGANDQTESSDTSLSKYPVIFNGNAHLDSNNARYGSSSLALDGNGDFLTISDSDDWYLASGSFTIDFWAKSNGVSSDTQFLVSQYDPSLGAYWSVWYDPSNKRLWFTGDSEPDDSNDFTIYANWAFDTDWHHIAIVRSGVAAGDWRFFIDGKAQPLVLNTGGWDKSITQLNGPLNIGSSKGTHSFFNGYLDNLRISKGVTRWTGNFTLPVSQQSTLQLSSYPDPNQTLLLHMNSADNGINPAHPVTFNGDARLDTADVKLGSSSLALDGNGDYLSLPAGDDWSFGTEDFTIDTWVKFNGFAAGGYMTFLYAQKLSNTEQTYLAITSAGLIEMAYRDNYVTGTSAYSDSLTWDTGKWYHIASVRENGVVTFYRDGTAVGGGAFASDIGNWAGKDVWIGYYDHTWWHNGYIDEFRISKGIARWASNFTPPDAEYHNPYKTTGSFTSNPILLDANELKTISWGELTPVGTDITIQTRTGNTSSPDSTWSDWSTLLTDPAGSHITSPAAKYIQYKVNLLTNDPQKTPKLLPDSSGNFIKIDYTKKYGEVLDADAGGTFDNLEQKIIDPSFPQDPSLYLTMDGANDAAIMLDSSANHYAVTFNGNAYLDTSNKKTGSSSLALDGNGDFLTISDSDDWYLGNGNFTIDFWAKSNGVSSDSQFLMSQQDPSLGEYWAVWYDPSNKRLWFTGDSEPDDSNDFTIYANWAFDTDWHHIAIVRSGTTQNDWRFFIDGKAQALVLNTGGWDKSIRQLNGPLNIGSSKGTHSFFNGYMDELHISKGAVRWTSDFTPPVPQEHALQLAAYPDPNQTLLLHMNGNDNAINPTHPVTLNGNAHLDTTNARFGSSALAFDGNGDYITLPDSADWTFGTDPFTIDYWVKWNTTSSLVIGQQTTFAADRTYFYSQPGGAQFFSIDGGIQRVNFTIFWDSLPLNTWHHIALARISNANSPDAWAIFIDGKMKTGADLTLNAGSWNGNIADNAGHLVIGASETYAGGTPQDLFNGYADEIRVSKGVARWTSDFSDKLPDAEYHNPYKTTGSFTSNPILLDANELKTISWGELTPDGTDITIQTRTGSTSNPDSTWSDWSTPLTDPSGSDITSPAAKYIQYRINMTTNDQEETPQILLSGDSPVSISYIKNTSLGSDVSLITVERDGIKYRYDKDGKFLYAEENNNRFYYDASNHLVKVIDKDRKEYSYTYDQGSISVNSNQDIPLALNEIPNIAIDNLSINTLTGRNALGLSSYQDTYTKLLLHAETPDVSGANHPVTFNGDARLDNTNPKFGQTALKFDGSGDYLTIPDSEDWNFGSGDYTVDFWAKHDGTTTNHRYISHHQTSDESYWQIGYVSGTNGIYFVLSAPGNSEYVILRTGVQMDTAWHHIAFVKKGHDHILYKDGVQIGVVSSENVADSKGLLYIGIADRLGNDPFGGSMDELRISKGIARWTSGFTPPDSEYRNIFYNNDGTLTSDPMAITATSLDYILANLKMPVGTNVIFKTRTGASSDVNDGSWSDWVEATHDAVGYKINSPVNKYVQYQATFTTTDTTQTPSLYENDGYAVKLTYNYNMTFDATAPPVDVPFKDHFTITPPAIPISSNITALQFDSSLMPQLNKYIRIYEASKKEIAGYTISKADGDYFVEGDAVVRAVKKGDNGNTIIEYYPNGWAKSITAPDGTVTYYDYEVDASLSDGLHGATLNAEIVGSGAEQALELASYPDPNQTLLLHMNGNDNSINPTHPVTFNGGAKIDTANSKFGGSSYNFDGSSTFSLADSADLRFTENTTPVTIDFWIYPTTDTDGSIFYKSDGTADGEGFQLWRYGSGLVMFQGVWGNSTGGIFNFGVGVAPKNEWTHLAITKDSNLVWRGYANGVGGATGHGQNKYTLSLTSPLVFGTHHPWPGFDVGDFHGYIDEFRVSNNVRWASGFTPPDSEYRNPYKTTGSFTSTPILLDATELKTISWNESIKEGVTDIIIQTRTGNTAAPDSTWSDWSAPLTDPSGSNIQSPAAKYIQYKVNLLTNDPQVSPKMIADSDGNFIKIDYTKKYGEVLEAGTGGIFDNLEQKIIDPSLPQERALQVVSYPDPNQKLLLHMNGNDNTLNPSHPVTFNGNARLDTTDVRFGSAAVNFDGSGDYLTIPESEDWNFGSGDFTADFWVKHNGQTTNHRYISNKKNTDTPYWQIGYVSGTNGIYFVLSVPGNSEYVILRTGVQMDTEWHHIAFVKKDYDHILYKDGVEIGRVRSQNAANSQGPLYVGIADSAGNDPLGGSMDEIRISKGVARWTSDFTPPDSEYHLYRTTGSFTSDPILIDAANLKTISWNELRPEGTDITVQTRTGNTATSDSTWSDWSAPLTESSGSQIMSPAAKYIQYRINMTTSDPQVTPQIIMSGDSPVSINYMQRGAFNDDVVSVKAVKNNITYRYNKDGRISEIVLPGSEVIRSVYSASDPSAIDRFEYRASDKVYWYDSSGSLTKVFDMSMGAEYTYTYGAPDTITGILAEVKHDIASDISGFAKSNLDVVDDVRLKSYTDMPVPVSPNYYRIPDIGTGSDGARHVTSDETLPLGEYNFTSLTIDAGKTLTVAAGSKIKSLDAITVDGTLLGSDLDINAFAIIIASGGVMAGSNQRIRANTINNSGSIGNVFRSSAANFSLSGYGGASTYANAYDGDLNTYSGYSYRERGGNGYFYNGNYTYWTWTFPTPQDITKLSWKIYSAAQTWAGASENSGGWGVYITVTHSGGTSVLAEESGGGAGWWSGGYSQNNNLVEKTGSWTGVTKVEVRLYGKAKRVDDGAGGGDEDVYHRVYEMEAEGAAVSYINGSGDLSPSADTADFTNALKYHINGWIGEGGIRSDILAQIAEGSTTLLDDLYHGNVIYEPSGTLTSHPIQMSAVGTGNIFANIDTPAGTGVRFMTRTGSSPYLNDGSWSVWSEAAGSGGVYRVDSPINKFIQYQAIFTTSDIITTPSMHMGAGHAVKISYSSDEPFDANAPPAGTPFANRLKFTAPPSPNLPSDVHFDVTEFNETMRDAAIPDDAPIATRNFKAELLSQITLTDGTVIKYFNEKPTLVTLLDGSHVDDIVLEKYNIAITDYKVENGMLIGYAGSSDNKVIVSFTAVNSTGDIYIFRNNTLVEIRRSGGTIITSPAQDAFSQAIFDLLKRAFSPETLQGDKIKEAADISINLDRSSKVTYYINNKMAATYYRHDDGRLDLLVDYSYDESGNLILVRLPYARDSIDKQISGARQKIEAEKAAYLLNLAQQQNLAYQQIQQNVESVRAQINAERDRLRPYLYQQVTRVSQGCWGPEYYTETVEVPEVRNALNQLDEQERILNEEAAKAYAQLNSQIAAAQAKLDKEEADSLKEVAVQEKTFHSQIIKEESTPIIIDYYRSYLGRDPDDAETDYWLAKVGYNSKINVGELKASLLLSTERSVQESFVNGLKTKIADKLNEYLKADANGKTAILGWLGLSESDIVQLDQTEVDAIIGFLGKQNIHFGRSAFVVLEALLKENNIPYALEDLAFKVILVDIFTGAISAVSEGKLLELSMYALSKAASLYGLTLYNTKLDFEDLVQIFNSSGSFIAHFKNNHFVVVTDVAADGKVTYTELNKGKDGRTYTVSKEDFKNAWTGYAIVQAQSPKGTAPEWVNSKIISVEMAQRIKGSCFFFLFALIGMFIQGVVTIAAGIVAGIAAVVMAVTAVIAPIIEAIGMVIMGITNLLAGIVTQIFSVIQFVGVSLLKGIGAFFGGTLFAGSLASIGPSATGFSLTGLGMAIGKTVVLGALSFGISKGLDALGLDPIVSSLIGSFITGGVSGLFTSFSPIGFIAGGLQGLAVQGVSVLGQKLGIDPMLTSVIGLAAGSIISAGLNGVWKPIFDANGVQIRSDFLTGFDAIGYAMNTTILPNVVGELAYYGVGKLGEMLGVDPRISYLAGIGIRSMINPGIDPKTGNPRSMWDSVTTGLLQGVASVGINYATEELGLNPLLANIGFSAISALLNAGIQALMPSGEKDVFKTIFDTYKQNALTFLGYAEPGITLSPWQQAAYIAQIHDFTEIVMERGLVDALNTYGASFFNAIAVNEIVKSGYTLGGYFAEKLATGQYRTETRNGEEVAAVNTPTQSDGGHSTGFFKWMLDEGGVNGVWDPLGQGVTSRDGKSDFWGLGKLGKDSYGRLGFYDDSALYRNFGNLGLFQTIENGNQTYASITDLSSGNPLLTVTPDSRWGYNLYDWGGKYVDARINDFISGQFMEFKDLRLVDYTNGSGLRLQEADEYLFAKLGISSEDITDFNVTRDFGDGLPELGTELSNLENPPDGVVTANETIFLDSIDTVSSNSPFTLTKIKSMADFVNNLEASLGGARLERVTRIVNGESREFVKVFGKVNDVINLNGRWHRAADPAVAKYFSSAAAAGNKLKFFGAGGITTALIVSQDLLDAVANGEPILSRNFAVDVGLDLAVGLGSSAAGAAAGAWIGGMLGSAVPVVGTAIGIAVGAGVGWLAGKAIDYFHVRERLKGQQFNLTVP